MTRLSSGLRINRASDDAAGLSISTALKSDARLYTQALRNVSDGTTILSTASSALSSLADLNAQMVELATEAASGSISSEQRLALDAEQQKLIKEHNRIINSASFKGEALFSSALKSFNLKVGVNSSSDSTVAFSTNTELGNQVGTGNFAAVTSYAVGTGPGAVVSGDLNGDGRSDVITANSGSDNISVMLGNADGTLGTATNIAVGTNPIDLTIADFNGDGALDIVSANNGSGAGTTASILLGTGTGSFTVGQTLTLGTGPLSVAVGDLNNDGKVDVVTTATGGGSAGTANFSSGAAEVSSLLQLPLVPQR